MKVGRLTEKSSEIKGSLEKGGKIRGTVESSIKKNIKRQSKR